MRSRSCPFSSRSIFVVRCESASALSRALVSSACLSWSCWISDCTEDADTDVAAVEALENTVRGVEVASPSGYPAAREALRAPQDELDPASENAMREGVYLERESRSILLRVVPKREGGRLALPGESFSKSSNPAAAKAFAVRGPSQSVIALGTGTDGGSIGDFGVTRCSITLVLRFRVRRLPVSLGGRSMSKLGRWSCKRLGAVPIEEGGLDDGEAESTSQPLFWAELNRDNGGRELLAEAEEGREGVMSRDAAVRRVSPLPPLPGRRNDEDAEVSRADPRVSRLAADADPTDMGRSGLEDIARPDGVRVVGEGSPEAAVPNIGRSDTDLVMRGREEEGRRGAADSEEGVMRRIDVLGSISDVCAGDTAERNLAGGDGGGLETGGGIALIATSSAGSVLCCARFGLSSAARSGSSESMLKLVSGLSGVRSRLIAESDGTSSTTTPCSQSCLLPVSDNAASTSLVSFEVERSRAEVSLDGDELPCRVLCGGGCSA